jgi:hypothetical protein
MLVHKLNSRTMGAMLAISVAATAAVVIRKQQPVSYPLGIKGDRLELTPQAGCSQVVWPYGCDWHLNALADTRKHSRFGRRGRNHPVQKRFLS